LRTQNKGVNAGKSARGGGVKKELQKKKTRQPSGEKKTYLPKQKIKRSDLAGCRRGKEKLISFLKGKHPTRKKIILHTAIVSKSAVFVTPHALLYF